MASYCSLQISKVLFFWPHHHVLLVRLQTELMRVDVETVSELSAGQTVCDVWDQSDKPKNAYVAQVSNKYIDIRTACRQGLCSC